MLTHTYDLPDHPLIDPDATTPAFMVWQPERTVIVLGQSNQAETAVHLDLAEEDSIPVYKRSSGGQTVILTPKTVVISVRLISERLDNPQVYFRRINGHIIEALINLGVTGLTEKGISDIALGELKILGSSIYRKRSMVFYHAVLNVAENPAFIGRYLRHPTREPDYRAGRKHEDFVTSLHSAGFRMSAEEILVEIRHVLGKKL